MTYEAARSTSFLVVARVTHKQNPCSTYSVLHRVLCFPQRSRAGRVSSSCAIKRSPSRNWQSWCVPTGTRLSAPVRARESRASEPGGCAATSHVEVSHGGGIRNPAGHGTQAHSMACGPHSPADDALPDQGRRQVAVRAVAQSWVPLAETVHQKDPAKYIGKIDHMWHVGTWLGKSMAFGEHHVGTAAGVERCISIWRRLETAPWTSSSGRRGRPLQRSTRRECRRHAASTSRSTDRSGVVVPRVQDASGKPKYTVPNVVHVSRSFWHKSDMRAGRRKGPLPRRHRPAPQARVQLMRHVRVL